MPLHLLHHKSWHVYNTANVEKVRRDQENARLKEEAEEARMNAADQERRVQLLRGNASSSHSPTVPEQAQDPSIAVSGPSNTIPGLKKALKGKGKHVNLFEDVESQKPVETNPEREKELAIEKKKWEDQITSKFVNATNDHSPWYAQLDKVSGVTKEVSDIEKEIQEKRQTKWKSDADPLKWMERFLENKREAEEQEERRREKMEREMSEREKRRRARTPENDGERHTRRRHEEERREGDKEGRRHRHRHRSRSPRREHGRHRRHHHHRSRSPEPDLEELRSEREKREAVEKEKIAKIMRRDEEVEDRYQPVGPRGYSAQFHPEAVRR